MISEEGSMRKAWALSLAALLVVGASAGIFTARGGRARTSPRRPRTSRSGYGDGVPLSTVEAVRAHRRVTVIFTVVNKARSRTTASSTGSSRTSSIPGSRRSSHQVKKKGKYSYLCTDPRKRAARPEGDVRSRRKVKKPPVTPLPRRRRPRRRRRRRRST